MYWLLVAVLAVVFSPMLFILIPLGALVLPCFCVINMLRATNGSPYRFTRLLRETCRAMWKQVFVYIPAIIPVGWFYVTKSNSQHHHGIRCHIPYEAYYVAWRRRRLSGTTHSNSHQRNVCGSHDHESLAASSPLGTPQKLSGTSRVFATTPGSPPLAIETTSATTTASVLQQATGVLFGFPPQTPLPYHPGNRSFSSPLGSSSFGATSTTSFSSAVFHATSSTMTSNGHADPNCATTTFPARGRLNLCTLDVYSAPQQQSTAASRSTSVGSSSASSSSGNNSNVNATATQVGDNNVGGKSANGSFRQSRSLAPVIVFLHGGGWSWGEKWHCATIAHQLRNQAGACVVVPDYPKFPQGTILDMVESVHAALQWVKDHAALYGGDATRIHLVGHSAGAHLAQLWSVRRAMALLGVSCSDLLHPAPQQQDGTPEVPASVKQPQPMPISLFSIPQSTRATLKKLPNSVGRTADNVSVDFTTGPLIQSLMLFAGVYDLAAHQAQLELRCTDAVSSLASAVDGLWRECSPLILLEELSKRLTQQVLAAVTTAGAPSTNAAAAALLSSHNLESLFPQEVSYYHDPVDDVVAYQQSALCHDAMTSCFKHLATIIHAFRSSSPSAKSPVSRLVTFPYGHDTIILTSMPQSVQRSDPRKNTRDGSSAPTLKEGRSARPLIDEITRVVNY